MTSILILAVSKGPQLRIFNTILYNAQGDSGLLAVSVENMVAMTDRTLPVSGSRTINYSINIPAGIEGELHFSAKLRFPILPAILFTPP
ncbi:MAG: hypothetical protein CM1200mP10_14060 [Candidatus Neomarinimicrobiota bacterium]|nr:MAG: hypothetical protein CM1200mP10_14060 [Candidatus Neomarinimicrobiota bacterium]